MPRHYIAYEGRGVRLYAVYLRDEYAYELVLDIRLSGVEGGVAEAEKLVRSEGFRPVFRDIVLGEDGASAELIYRKRLPSPLPDTESYVRSLGSRMENILKRR